MKARGQKEAKAILPGQAGLRTTSRAPCRPPQPKSQMCLQRGPRTDRGPLSSGRNKALISLFSRAYHGLFLLIVFWLQSKPVAPQYPSNGRPSRPFCLVCSALPSDAVPTVAPPECRTFRSMILPCLSCTLQVCSVLGICESACSARVCFCARAYACFRALSSLSALALPACLTSAACFWLGPGPCRSVP